MSKQTTKSKSRVRKFFNIDKEAKKFYPTLKCQNELSPVPVYTPQRISRTQVVYRPMGF